MKFVLCKQQRRAMTGFLSVCLTLGACAVFGFNGTLPTQKQLQILESIITEIAVQFVGMPVKFGGDPEIGSETDNSHLFCAIYRKAAQLAGLYFSGYMTISELLAGSQEVNPCCLKNGDLMVLTDGHAAMIYGLEDPETFWLIYASEIRGEVTVFSSRHLVYEVYWRKYLKGFYRPGNNMFLTVRPEPAGAGS